MKIFALYFKVKIQQKPEWFDAFLQKYYESSDLHVTLLQARSFDDSKIDDLKLKIFGCITQHKFTDAEKRIDFGYPAIDLEEDGTYTVMLPILNEKFLSSFQKEVRGALEECGDYVDATTVQYEEDFKPHITIGVNVKSESVEEIKSLFSRDFSMHGVVTDLVLPIVKNTSLEERYNPDNLTIFKI